MARTARRAVAIRDSKSSDGPVLLIRPQQFAALLTHVHGGRLIAKESAPQQVAARADLVAVRRQLG
jgi:hypothetical protein